MSDDAGLVLDSNNKHIANEFFRSLVELGIEFKLQKEVRKRLSNVELLKERIVTDLPRMGQALDGLFKEFAEAIMPDCTNFGSTGFLGFPDCGNSVAGIGGGIISEFLQQNLINQSFCAPSATFVEMAVLCWLRQTVGYANSPIDSVWDVGGIVTPGGTSSNTIAMLLARENKSPNTLETGVSDPSTFQIIVPRGIGHYSVKSAQRWLGCGGGLIEVDTEQFRYEPHALKRALEQSKGRVMALVAYAGDSRTMTVDYLDRVVDLVRDIDPGIWLHADACHGFCLGFSETLRHKIKGIELFDSISTDPQKVMLVPYTISALLVREPSSLKTITSLSDLIMQEHYAFGQVTPFIGSKSWASLKLWFMMKNFGWDGLDELVTRRWETARTFHSLVAAHGELQPINDVEINSVAFMYTGGRAMEIAILNDLNKRIHSQILDDGLYHLHQFSIADPGIFEKGATIYPLRYMSGNPNLGERELADIVEYVVSIGRQV